VEVGVPAAAKLEPGKPRSAAAGKPIVFYGTSITQGGCASRPGMVHTAILGRWLDWSVVNLGFSGNGRMEAEVGKLMAEIDASVYVIDCLPNITAAQVTERTFGLVTQLREARPGVPIVLVEDRNYTDSVFVASKARRNASSQKALKAEFEKLKSAGVDNLHYVRGEELLGDDGEGTVDSSHPTDLGFMRQAEALRKVLKPLVGSKN
jgi:lysophospholipase L1-like esterase